MGCGLSLLRPLFDGENPNVKYYTGFSNNCMTFNSKLYRSNRSVLCSVKLMKFAEKGTLLHNDTEYKLEHRFESGVWEIIDNDRKVLFSAFKPSTSSSSIIFNLFNEAQQVVAKSIMKWTTDDGPDREVVELPLDVTDIEAMKDELESALLVTIINENYRREWKIEEIRNKNVSEKYLAFIFMMHLVMCKRKVRDEEEEQRRKKFGLLTN